jgi:serine/threonine protein phosphatase PrpC
MWKAIAYAARGKSHIATSTPCQDKVFYTSKGDINLIALSDGAGSAKLSHFGAEKTIQAVSAFILGNYQRIITNEDGVALKREMAEYLQKELRRKAKELSCDIDDLAATLLVAAADKNTFFIVHVGDGVIGFIKDSKLKVISSPQNGEFANMTFFVTAADVLQHLNIYRGKLTGVSGFILMSDGTAESFYRKSDNTLVPALVKMMRLNMALPKDRMEELLIDSFEKLVTKRSQDDCSIALLTRKEGVLSDYGDMGRAEKRAFLGKLKSDAVKRYDSVVNILSTPKTVEEVSAALGIKKQYLLRYISKLTAAGIIVKSGDYYKNI